MKYLLFTTFCAIIQIMIKFFTETKFSENDLQSIPSATLAWIGDAVFSLCAREFMLRFNHGKPARLNRAAVEWVNAEAQSKWLEKIKPYLDETELGVVRRARNAPITTKSKHYGLADYRRATGLEALIGYLYLADKMDRLNEILAMIFGENDDNLR